MEQAARIEEAVRLIEQALALVDTCPGEKVAGCYLQTGLDELLRVPPMKEGDVIDPAFLARFGFGPPAPTSPDYLSGDRNIRDVRRP